MKPMFRFSVLATFIVLLLAATGVQAALYTVTMKNGSIFETRYAPIPADFDENIMLLRTDRGNWIGLEKEEIEDIVSAAEASGFGYQLDTTTLYLGWSPNDLVQEIEGEDGTTTQRYEADAPPSTDSYSINQFLSYGGATPASTSVGAGTPLFTTTGDN